MGTLKPGVTYIYERADGIVWRREAGSDPSTRQVVGYESGADYDPYRSDPHTADGRPLRDYIREDKLWGEIRRAARTNPALQDALDRVIIIHQLSKTDE